MSGLSQEVKKNSSLQMYRFSLFMKENLPVMVKVTQGLASCQVCKLSSGKLEFTWHKQRGRELKKGSELTPPPSVSKFSPPKTCFLFPL